MSWVGLAVGVGAGIAKSQLVDKPKEDADRQLASDTQRYAYLTGNKAQPVQRADVAASALSGAQTGAAMGQNFQNAQAQNELAKAQMGWLNRGGSAQSASGLYSMGRYGPRNPSLGVNTDFGATSPWGFDRNGL